MMVDIRNICFSYNGRDNIWEDVCFSVETGQILSILGPNGCGKTTLLKCLNVLFTVSRGEIVIDGQPVSMLKRSDIGKMIGYIPQTHDITFPYTVREMVIMGRSAHVGLFSSPTQEDIDIAWAAIEAMSITHLADRPFTNISGGEAQLVLIARALAAEPKVLLLDEPTSHLDFRNQLAILDVLERLAKEKEIATIMTTHFPDHALSISDTALLLGFGNTKTDCFKFGSTDNVITEENMNRVFGIEIKIVPFRENGEEVKTVVPLRRKKASIPEGAGVR